MEKNLCQTISSQSVLSHLSSPSSHCTQVGILNPISLPVLSIQEMAFSLGKQLTNGDQANIYSVQNSQPPSIYKIMSSREVESGDAIRIARLAGELGIAPPVHSAFLIKENSDFFVATEMDKAGKSLGRWMTDLAEEGDISKAAAVTSDRAFEAKMQAQKKIRESGEKFTIVEIPNFKKLSIEEAIQILYGRQESFYFDLFSKIKRLAEHKIAYFDCHVGNIIPNTETSGNLQLIDFDSAEFQPSVKDAAEKVIHSAYVGTHFRRYMQLSELSDTSLTLISWFLNPQMDPGSPHSEL